MEKVFIIKYKRTPISNYLSQFSKFKALDLGKEVINNLTDDFDKKLIEQGYVGNVLSSGTGQNLGRQILFECGINIPCITLNRVCSSGMVALIEAYKTIKLGDKDCIIAGGVESMSNAPYLQNNIRSGKKFGNIELVDSLLNDGLIDSYSKRHMGEITEDLCQEYMITRYEQDNYAKESYRRSREAVKNNLFNNEIINIMDRKNNTIVNEDEEINKIEDLNKLDKLKPVFKIDGTITPGNASKISDGACFFIIASEKFIKNHSIKPIAEIIDYDMSSGNPSDFPLIPNKSINNLLKKNNLEIEDIDYFEINEAFAIAPIMCHKKLNIPYEKMNVYGGAISMGHPIGCSGARIVATLLTIMNNKNAKRGCASICNGGGGASSLIIEIVD